MQNDFQNVFGTLLLFETLTMLCPCTHEAQQAAMASSGSAPSADALIVGCEGAGKTLLVRQMEAMCSDNTLSEYETASTVSAAPRQRTVASHGHPLRSVYLRLAVSRAHTNPSPPHAMHVSLHTRAVQTGVEIDTVTHSKVDLKLREVGSPMTPMWPSFYGDCHCIVFVVDLSNLPQVAAVTVELFDMLRHARTQSKDVLLLLNKRDSPVRMSREFVDSAMRLEDLVATVTQKVTIMESSAKTGDGVEAVMDYVLHTKRHREAVAKGADDSDSD